MAFVVRFAKSVRNNWKKSLFGVTVLTYGGSYLKEKYDIHQLMRTCCEEAAKYGEIKAPASVPLPKVTVLINPSANRRASEEAFETYCQPILFLAGMSIDIVKTESEGHARKYIEGLQNLPDALIIAGGDGTLSEAVTGMFRRSTTEQCPMAIIPVGRTNSVAKKMFASNMSSKLEEAQGITNAALSIVRGKVEKKDVMKIEIIPDDQSDVPLKPVYAIGSLQWGAFRDILAKRDKYWWTNGLRQYSAFLFNSFSDDATWNCSATLTYSDPCEGCRNCFNTHHSPAAKAQSKRWWSKFIPTFQLGVAADGGADKSKIVNDECSKLVKTQVRPSEILVLTDNIVVESIDGPQKTIPKLSVMLGKEDYYGFGFMTESWKRLDHPNQMDGAPAFTARTVEIIPDALKKPEADDASPASKDQLFFSIDNEAYEVKPVRISLLPQAVPMYIL